ncbi:MAG: hypothetical protein AAGL68_05560 [Pseudomonadota bacterium]
MLFETKSAEPDHTDTSDDNADTAQPETSRRARRYRPRRTTSDRVREALLVMCEGHANLLTHEEKPWASITFSGSRHEVMIDFDGIPACKVGENFIAALPDHGFTIPGHLVADATISSVESNYTPEPRMVVTAVLLLLEDA